MLERDADPRQPGDFAHAAKLIREIEIALLTTADGQGRLHTRPLQTLAVDPDRTLWFFTDRRSPKVSELEREIRVSLGYADPGRKAYVAVDGVATLLEDPGRAKQLWSTEQRAYYPDGPSDDRLVVLRVRMERIEYWLAPGRASYLVAALRAAVTGTPAGIIGEHGIIE
jgi:general stress protein 26